VEKDNGFLVAKGSATAIENVLNELIRQPEKLHLMKKASRQKTGKMSWQKAAGAYLEIFRNSI